MTHPHQSNARDEVFQRLAENGFDGMAQAIEILMDEAMSREDFACLGLSLGPQRIEKFVARATGCGVFCETL